MHTDKEILDKIDQLGKDDEKIEKTKRMSIALPENLIEYVKRLRKAKGYKSDSYTIRKILENYFNNL